MMTATTPIPRSHKVFFAVIFIAAVVVAAGGLVAPKVLADMLPWFVLPPLHARFLGAIYLFGALYMLGCLVARWQYEVRYALPLIALFGGMLLLVSVLNLGVFEFGTPPVIVWFGSYVIYPLIALALFLRSPRPWPVDPARPDLPRWASTFLLVQGALVAVLAVLLLVLPATVATSWPWPVTTLLAQAYAGPLLAYGVASLLASRFRTWREVRALIPGMLAFTAVTLVASVVHSGVFGSFDAIDAAWFAAFAVATVILGVMTVELARHAAADRRARAA